MKRVLLIFAAILLTTTAFAQQFSAGLRVGSGVQAVGQYKYDGKNYIEARFGASWCNGGVHYKTIGNDVIKEPIYFDTTADFTLLHNWHLLDMDWTPRGGMWFVDAGAGINVGGKAHDVYAGVAGMARLGFTFNNLPLTVAVDWTPTFGPGIRYSKGANKVFFNELGLANVGISCTYKF